jgi:uncharacterized membrane protein
MAEAIASGGAAMRSRASVATGTRPLGLAGVLLIAAGSAVWTAIVAALAIMRHEGFRSHRFDLGNMVQAVWSTTQGRPLDMTDGASGDQINRLAAHVDPILVLFTPFWWVHPAPETLIVVYVAALAAGVYPVVRLALKHTGSRLVAALLGAWYLTLPWVIWIGLNEVNPMSLALPLLLYAIWALDDDRLGRFAVFAVLAVLCGELIGITVAALGVWYALARRRTRAGLVIAAAGVAWTATCLLVVIPAVNDGESSRYFNRFETVGGTPLGLARTLFTDPGTVVTQLTSTGDLQYLALLAIPTALLFLGQPWLLIAAAPQLATNMISDYPATVSPAYHYSAPVIAVVVAASVLGLGRLPSRGRVVAAAAMLTLAITMLLAALPVPGTEGHLAPERETAARVAALDEAVALVPASAPVTVTNRVGAHLSARGIVHLFPARADAEWAVLDTRDPSNTTASWIGPVPFATQLGRLDRDPSWRLVFEREGVRVYRKVS